MYPKVDQRAAWPT